MAGTLLSYIVYAAAIGYIIWIVGCMAGMILGACISLYDWVTDR